jgi:predicted pyridoxine 5'-phosphate oxidase superfamily flavin-nucleotide-binding protein
MAEQASPFHDGEQQMQSLVGVRERMEQVGAKIIRDHMPDQHRDFFAQLPFVVVAGLDGVGHPWASLMAGPPGFMQSPDPQVLNLHGHLLPGDPLAPTWQAGEPVGLLGIEPHTRRRNRMNGTLARVDGGGASVAVQQSFGNCPKYIQPREAVWSPGEAVAPTMRPEGANLSARAQDIVAQADTFFIASASAQARATQEGAARSEGVDVSHRGGLSGFVQVGQEDGATLLTVPDYTGNFMFNTLGNIVSNPKVGLLFIDFASGALLWLQGLAHVEHGSEQGRPGRDWPQGAQRLLHIRIKQGLLHDPDGAMRRSSPLAWSEE